MQFGGILEGTKTKTLNLSHNQTTSAMPQAVANQVAVDCQEL